MADDARLTLRADTEQAAQNYLESQIHPVLIKHKAINPAAINNYFVQAERGGDYHLNRRMYDDTLTLINQKMASVLDQAQLAAQSVYPHYYERYKTDGVEHNMYIGQSISPAKKYDINMLYNLRLWQLQVMCQMELEYRVLKDNLPYQLDVASLILAYNHPMSIRFRLDEKRFDVDGSYNARFEVIKKRIDKARIKNSAERLTKPGKMTIVYTNSDEEAEYLRYINFLQSRKLFEDDLEILEIEELQGVSGLKAIRAGINYENDPAHFKFTSFDDLVCEEQVIVG
ncbi:hypothetical protein [Mucilaginibacter endophyticus]|uniref:hypothetical protein n=1 Tax=Mucilaginibacter endophyticus TaxID=2675003 RepID=UPI000E0D607F|nr:hypothetical protein [Mucilaginibacter endophyticus]